MQIKGLRLTSLLMLHAGVFGGDALCVELFKKDKKTLFIFGATYRVLRHLGDIVQDDLDGVSEFEVVQSLVLRRDIDLGGHGTFFEARIAAEVGSDLFVLLGGFSHLCKI